MVITLLKRKIDRGEEVCEYFKNTGIGDFKRFHEKRGISWKLIGNMRYLIGFLEYAPLVLVIITASSIFMYETQWHC
jgi:hypothetical protein